MRTALLFFAGASQVFAPPAFPEQGMPRAPTFKGDLPVEELIREEAVLAGLRPKLAIDLAWHESRLQTDRISSAGAVGPMQIIPRFFNLRDPRDAKETIHVGVRHLAKLVRQYGERRALCFYAYPKFCS